MKLSGLHHLRQQDGITCGPSVAVMAGALLDPQYRAALSGPDRGRAWFASEQRRVHAEVNRIWPRRLGTTPMGMTRALTAHSTAFGIRYGWRTFRGRRDRLADVLREVNDGWPVAMLIGSVIPRHWVLVVGAAGVRCRATNRHRVKCGPPLGDIQRSRLTGLGYPRPFGFVLPREATRSATR